MEEMGHLFQHRGNESDLHLHLNEHLWGRLAAQDCPALYDGGICLGRPSHGRNYDRRRCLAHALVHLLLAVQETDLYQDLISRDFWMPQAEGTRQEIKCAAIEQTIPAVRLNKMRSSGSCRLVIRLFGTDSGGEFRTRPLRTQS